MIKCTYLVLSGLRDINGKAGPLTKLAAAEDTRVPLLMDRIRIGRFVKAVTEKIKEMEAATLALLKTYGTTIKDDPSRFNIASNWCHTCKVGQPNDKVEDHKCLDCGAEIENRYAKFQVENANLNAMECEILVLPLPQSAYEKLPLTSGDLMALEPFVVLPEDPDASVVTSDIPKLKAVET